MLYNLFTLLLLLAWVLTGFYTLDYLERQFGEGPRGRTWLNLAALFLGPVVLLTVFCLVQVKEVLPGDTAERETYREPGRRKKKKGKKEGDDLGLEIVDAAGNPVDPVRDNPNSEATMILARRLLLQAIERGANRLLVLPDQEGEYNVLCRVDGVEEPLMHLGMEGAGLISAYKQAAGMKVEERRSSQSGIFFAHSAAGTTSCGAYTSRMYGTERIVLRLGAAPGWPLINALGLSGSDVALLRAKLREPNGFILVCGPAGAGKTATMYALLQTPELAARRVVSIENPIEAHIDTIQQLEVNPADGWTPLKILHEAINHSSDVLVVGDLVDAESARLLINAAAKDRLVIACMDTRTPLEVFERFFKWEVPFRQLSRVNLLMINQLMVRTACGKCSGNVDGCRACQGKGYGGVTAAFDIIGPEVLAPVLAIDGVNVTVIKREIGQRVDGTGLIAALHRLSADGVISAGEAERAAAEVKKGA